MLIKSTHTHIDRHIAIFSHCLNQLRNYHRKVNVLWRFKLTPNEKVHAYRYYIQDNWYNRIGIIVRKKCSNPAWITNERNALWLRFAVRKILEPLHFSKSRLVQVARPMGAALADAIADEQSRSVVVSFAVCVVGKRVVWPAGSCVEFFTYLLVVIWSFTLDGSKYVPRRTTWVSLRRRTRPGWSRKPP